MTPCQRLKHLMFDFAAGELDEKDRLTIQSHLGECPACNRFVEQIRALRTRLGHLKPVHTSDDFILRLRSRIRQESVRQTRLERTAFSPRKWAPAFGLGILFLVTGLLLLDQNRLTPHSNIADNQIKEPAPIKTKENQASLAAPEKSLSNGVSDIQPKDEKKLASQSDSSKTQDKLDEVRSRIRTVSY